MFLPILFVVGLACLAGASRPSRPVAGIVSGAGRRRRTASSLLAEYAQAGQRPPPSLISAALAEAQHGGHHELVRAIVDTYIRPVVEAAEGRPPWSHGHGHGHSHGHVAPVYAPAPAPAPYAPAPAYAPALSYAPTYAPASALDYVQPAGDYAQPYGGGYAPDPAVGPSYAPGPGPAGSPVIPMDPGASDDDILQMIARLGAPPGQDQPQVVPPPLDPSTPLGPLGPLDGPPSSTGTDTLTVSGRSSPIGGVGTGEWSRFCDRMSRELPTYTSAHHVGQFRQRRGRLLELGIDPETVLASPDGQRMAFDADMSEAYRRAHAAGLLACVGHPVEVPTSDGPPQIARVTTSGVMAVVQAAGIDGAASWFRSPGDRQRFAGTTAVFSRANGVF